MESALNEADKYTQPRIHSELSCGRPCFPNGCKRSWKAKFGDSSEPDAERNL
jgi:hypothetical protein